MIYEKIVIMNSEKLMLESEKKRIIKYFSSPIFPY